MTSTEAESTSTHSPESSRAIRALRAAAAHVEHTLSKALEPHGLTPAQFSALHALAAADGNPMGCSELGQKLVGPAPDVTRLLDRLVGAELVSRDRDGSDRRLVHTRITAKGKNLLDRAIPSVCEAEERALAGLDEDGRRVLADLLGDVRRNCPGTSG